MINMKKSKIIFSFLVLMFCFLVTSCKTKLNSQIDDSISNNGYQGNNAATDSNIDNELASLKKKYEDLIVEKKRLSIELEQLKKNCENAQIEINELISKMNLIDEEVSNSFSLFSHLENDILKSSLMVMSSSSVGSGFVVKNTNNYCYIMTNNHVVSKDGKIDYDNIKVIDYNLNCYIASIMFTDPNYDMALLKVDRISSQLNLPSIKLSLKDPDIDDNVISIGNPYRQFNSIGIGKVLSYCNNNHVDYKVICHDAYMDHGNSGGMLINLKFEVVGINTWGITEKQYEKWIGESSPISKIYEFLSKNGFSI